MKNFINYRNEELEEKLKDILGTTYGIFQPLFIDLILKRKEVFNLSDEEAIREMEVIKHNVQWIQYSKLEVSGYAYYDYKTKRIRIDPSVKKEDLYGTIIHEILHALSTKVIDEDQTELDISPENLEKTESKESESAALEIGIWKHRKYRREDLVFNLVEGGKTLGLFGERFMETINEATARLFFSREGVGYPNRIFYVNAFVAMVGSSKVELFKEGNQSLQKFLDKIYENFPSDMKEQVNAYITNINENFNLYTYYSALIDSVRKSGSFITAYRMKKEIGKQFEGLHNNTCEMLELQIANDKREINDEYIGEIATRYKMIEQSFMEQGKSQERNISEKYKGAIALKQQEVLQTLCGLYVFNIIKGKLTDEDILKQYEDMSRSGKVEELADRIKKDFPDVNLEEIYNSFQKYMENRRYEECNYYKTIFQKDNFGGKKWNDEETDKMMESILDKCTENEKGKHKDVERRLPSIKDVLNDKSLKKSQYQKLEEESERYCFYKQYCLDFLGYLLNGGANNFYTELFQNEVTYVLKEYYMELLQYTESYKYQDEKGIDIKKIYDTINGIELSNTKMKDIVEELLQNGIFSDTQTSELISYFEERKTSAIERIYRVYDLNSNDTRESLPTRELAINNFFRRLLNQKKRKKIKMLADSAKSKEIIEEEESIEDAARQDTRTKFLGELRVESRNIDLRSGRVSRKVVRGDEHDRREESSSKN